MTAIFWTVMLDMLSFGLVIPDIQLRGRELIAAAGLPAWLDQGLVLGALMATFSLVQFVVAPFLGRLSDKIGRRPVLVVTCILAVLSSLVYAGAGALWIMVLARVLQGAAAANLGVAYAYVSDISDESQRSGMMGKLGAAFGIGFLLGPPLGSWLLKAGNDSPFVLGMVSAALAAVNLAFVLFLLPETVRKGAPGAQPEKLNLMRAMRAPGLGALLALFFVANFAFSNLESTFFLLAADQWRLDKQAASWVLVVVGLTQALTQGLVVPRLLPWMGELRALRLAYLIQSPAMLAVPFSSPWFTLIAGCLVLAFSGGLAQPSLSSLISKSAPADLAGGVFGATQSLGALARIFGPFCGGFLYERAYWLPYVVASVLLLAPLAAAWRLRPTDEVQPA